MLVYLLLQVWWKEAQVRSSGPGSSLVAAGLWVAQHTRDWKGFKPILKRLHNYCKVQNKTLETLTHALNYSVFHTL